jgi:proteasome lid subunit RPN8/RPN11
VSDAIRIRAEILAAIREQARREAPQECCGLLAGRDGVITQAFPAKNAAAKQQARYEIEPQQLFEIMHRMRAAQLELLGIYHSHPASENAPSPTDIERAYYPDTPYFILSPRPDARQPVRAFLIRDGRATEIPIAIE